MSIFLQRRVCFQLFYGFWCSSRNWFCGISDFFFLQLLAEKRYNLLVFASQLFMNLKMTAFSFQKIASLLRKRLQQSERWIQKPEGRRITSKDRKKLLFGVGQPGQELICFLNFPSKPRKRRSLQSSKRFSRLEAVWEPPQEQHFVMWWMLWVFTFLKDGSVFLLQGAGEGKGFAARRQDVFGPAPKVKSDLAAAPLLPGHLITSRSKTPSSKLNSIEEGAASGRRGPLIGQPSCWSPRPHNLSWLENRWHLDLMGCWTLFNAAGKVWALIGWNRCLRHIFLDLVNISFNISINWHHE